MVKTIYLIRHGETVGAETRRYKGSIDVPLSERGVEQMRKTSAFIGSGIRSQGEPENTLKLAAAYCSPLSRAVKSAEIVAENCGTAPVVVQDLRERHFGVWEGMSFDEIKERHPDEFKAWAGNPLKYSPIGGESTIEVRERVINALNMIMSNHTKSSNKSENEKTDNDASRINIAVVAHGGVNRIILCHLLGMPLENIFRLEQDFGAVNIIEFWDGYPVVKLINGGVVM